MHEQLHAVAAHGLARAQQMYASKRVDMEPLVIDVLNDFAGKGLVLVGAEVPVYDEREPLRVGSAIDLICKHERDNRLVIVELKVGGDNYYRKYNAYMEKDLFAFRIENSPLNQALMQLTAYKALFERCYGAYVQAHQIESYRVVFVGPSGVHHQHLSVDAVQPIQSTVMRMLASSGAARPKNRKRKSHQ